MYCKYCGKEISDNSKFCTYCGKPAKIDGSGELSKDESANEQKPDAASDEIWVENARTDKEEEEKSKVNTDSGNGTENESRTGEKKEAPLAREYRKKAEDAQRKRKLIIGSLIGVAAAIAAVVLIINLVSYLSKETVDVRDYAKIDYSQLEDQYSGTATIDQDNIENKIKTSLAGLSPGKLNSNVDSSLDGTDYLQIEWEELIGGISCELDKSKKIKNGDTLTVTITCDPQNDSLKTIENDIGVRIEGLGKSKKLEVKGLPERYKNGKDIPDDKLNSMKSVLDDEAKEAIYNEFADNTKVTREKVYFLSDKNSKTKNDVLLGIYRIKGKSNTDGKTHVDYYYSAVERIDSKFKKSKVGDFGDGYIKSANYVFHNRDTFLQRSLCPNLKKAVEAVKEDWNTSDTSYNWNEI